MSKARLQQTVSNRSKKKRFYMCVRTWEMGLVLSRVRNVIMIGKEE